MFGNARNFNVFLKLKMSGQELNRHEEASLLAQLKEGNQLAFGTVYKRYVEQTFSLSFKYLCDRQLAEDAVQNLFLKLWINRDRIDTSKPFNRYLFTILKNDLLNTLRDSKDDVFVVEDCLSMLINLESDTHTEQFDQEQIDMLRKAVDTLSPQRRKIFELKLTGNYSNQEIADSLALSINTVKFQYSQSLKQIRAMVRTLAILMLMQC